MLKIYTQSIYNQQGADMETAKLFKNGNSQAVRLPKAFRLPGDEVKIVREGKRIILEPIEPTWDILFESLNEFPEDFLENGRNQPPMQEREVL
jgi:antitoxin VapB